MSGGAGTIGRRRFLVLAASGGAAVVAAGTALWLARDDEQGPANPPAAAELPSPDAATRAVGERYLEAVPEEADAAELRRRLPPGLDGLPPASDAEQVAAATRRDFETGATVELDGWVLAATECRLAALAVVS